MKAARFILFSCAIAKAWKPSTRSFARPGLQAGPLLAVTKISALPDITPAAYEVQFLWFLPPGLSTAALLSYDKTRIAFHDFIDFASGHTWMAADGGECSRLCFNC